MKVSIKKLYEWTLSLSEYSGKSIEDAENFFKELMAEPELLKEFAYYYETREFLCNYNISGYTITDVVVWKMDHFRAYLDRADAENRYNKDKLIFESFEVMLQMKKEPETIISKMQSETGTDLPEGWTF